MNILEQLNKQEKIREKVFNLWDKGGCLEITPRFEQIAKIIGREYFNRTGKTGKIKIQRIYDQQNKQRKNGRK